MGNWLAERITQPRFGVIGSFVVNIVCLMAAFLVLWRVFMDPTGYLRMYTPMYGFAYIQWLLIAVLSTVLIFQYSPMGPASLKKHPLYKGTILLAVNIAAVYFFVNLFFQSVIGSIGIPYFSPEKLTQIGMSAFLAREYASAAALTMGSIAGLVIPIWVLHLNNWPVNEIPKMSGRITSLMLIGGIVFVSFFVIMHPHFGVLFYPWQKYVAAFPWWEKLFGTLSGNFNLGWLMCWTTALWITEITMEGYPFKSIKSQGLKAVAGICGTFLMGMALFFGFIMLQEIAWGLPVRGAKLMMAPDWRYLHAGETSIFILAAAMLWNVYFHNWPTRFSREVNVFIRFFIVGVSGAGLYNIYYKFNWMILGIQPGYAHPSQFPLAPLTLFILLLLIHDWFLDKWPGERLKVKEPEDNNQ